MYKIFQDFGVRANFATTLNDSTTNFLDSLKSSWKYWSYLSLGEGLLTKLFNIDIGIFTGENMSLDIEFDSWYILQEK